MADCFQFEPPAATAFPTESVSTYLQVLDLATANGLLDPALHRLTVDAIVNRWADDDSRWDLLPVTDEGPLAVPLRQACPLVGASPLADPATSSG